MLRARASELERDFPFGVVRQLFEPVFFAAGEERRSRPHLRGVLPPEAGRALAAWAFSFGIHELLAVVRPANRRAEATVRRRGMEWVGETDKYYDLRLQVYRLRPADLQPNTDW